MTTDLQAAIDRWNRIIASGTMPLVCEDCGRLEAWSALAVCIRPGCKGCMVPPTLADIVKNVAELIHYVEQREAAHA